MKTNTEDEEDSDEEDSEFDYDETALESFITPLDDEDTSPDEYQIFRTIGKLYFKVLLQDKKMPRSDLRFSISRINH